MRTIAAALFVLAVAACSSTKSEAPTTTTPTTTEPTTNALADDGLPSWTTVGRQYAGPPMSGRGGRYLIDVCPDGSYHHLLLDATVHGTWSPAAGGLLLKQADSEQVMSLSADGKDLGGMQYVGAPNCP